MSLLCHRIIKFDMEGNSEDWDSFTRHLLVEDLKRVLIDAHEVSYPAKRIKSSSNEPWPNRTLARMRKEVPKLRRR